MHELSIAHNIVNTCVATLADMEPPATAHSHEVISVHLQIGVLAGIVPQSLAFCWDVATAETPLAGACLTIEELPIVVYCPSCQKQQALADLYPLACPVCGTPTGEIVQGKELTIRSLELVD